MLVILESMFNMIEVGIYMGLIWSFNSTKILHFDNEYDFHMIFKNYEKNGYVHNLEFLTILHKVCFSYHFIYI